MSASVIHPTVLIFTVDMQTCVLLNAEDRWAKEQAGEQLYDDLIRFLAHAEYLKDMESEPEPVSNTITTDDDDDDINLNACVWVCSPRARLW